MPQLPQQPRYILCQFVPTPNGKTDKIPLNPHTLKAHNPFDKSIHMTYETAKELSVLYNTGIGFVFLTEDKYFFLDFDNCYDETTKTWSKLVLDSILILEGAYTEVSNSQRGIHIIGRYEGDRPVHKTRRSDLGLELYTGDRFVALAEIHPNGDAETIHTHTLLDYIIRLDLFNTESHNISDPQWTTKPDPSCNPPQDDNELIDFMLNRLPTGPEAFGSVLHIRDLWTNNIDELQKHFPTSVPGKPYDHSSADSALAYRLHYFTGGDCERILRLMCLSELKRDKWEREDYLPRTILNARGVKFHAYDLPRSQTNNNQPVIQNQQDLNIPLLRKENYPELSRTYKALDTSNNLKFLLDSFGITVQWNIMNRVREVKFPNLFVFKEDEENYALKILKNLALLNEFPLFRIDEHLDIIAQDNPYHPIVKGMQDNPWDGVPRLDAFIKTLHTPRPDLSFRLIRRWMISAMAAAHTVDGYSASGVLVLSGDQYIGKTRFIKSLDPFNCKAIKGGVLLDPTNKDCLRTIAEHWIVELGELDASFRKADIARLKSYLTEHVDKVRFPFGRKDSILPRRTVFAASVNDPNFLIDKTGNRRWWTIPITHIDFNHGLDMTQIWAEVYNIWNQGEQDWMTQEEFLELNEANTQHEQIDPFDELICLHFDFSEGWQNEKLSKFQATEVLLKLGYDKPTKSQATQMGQLLKKMTGKTPLHNWQGRYHYLLPKV